MERRTPTKQELDEIIEYWKGLPRGYGYYSEDSLLRFLYVFTPDQIKGAMYITHAKGRFSYFRYLCGVLHQWQRVLEDGGTPAFFTV